MHHGDRLRTMSRSFLTRQICLVGACLSGGACVPSDTGRAALRLQSPLEHPHESLSVYSPVSEGMALLFAPFSDNHCTRSESEQVKSNTAFINIVPVLIVMDVLTSFTQRNQTPALLAC